MGESDTIEQLRREVAELRKAVEAICDKLGLPKPPPRT